MPSSQSANNYLLEEDTIINDKWKILTFIAKGGKGEVYLAHQLNLDRQVALKIISQEFISSLEGDTEEINTEIKRFHREVMIMAQIVHPNILQVYDYDRLVLDGAELDFIVMEYVPGPTLRNTMAEEGFGQDENKVKNWINSYFFPILEGMKVVHDKGIVHRDLKPENILIDNSQPKIMDFGLAGGHHFSDVTQSHHMIGTINYMPEEQFLDVMLTDVRVDIYALGKILFEMIEGKINIGRNNSFEQVSLNKPHSLFFKSLDRIIQQATSRDRNQRTPSVKMFQASLTEAVMRSESSLSTPKKHPDMYWKVLMMITVSLLMGLVGFFTVFNLPHFEPTSDNVVSKDKLALENTIYAKVTPVIEFKSPQPTQLPDITNRDNLPATITGSDNMTMILLTGKEVHIPPDASIINPEQPTIESVPVKSIYMDRTKITNHLYVQFLHELEGVEVKNSSVFWKGQPILFLGETLKDYEPITFNDGTFRAKPEFATNPVVRVTPFGALAYAGYYGRSLPQTKQWFLAIQSDIDSNQQKEYSTSLPPENLKIDSNIQPATLMDSNKAGIQGLRQNVHEWTFSFSAEGVPKFFVHGLDNKESYLERQLGEAFANVGFRTVLNLDHKFQYDKQ